MIDEMIKVARTWRPLARLEVLSPPAVEGGQPDTVIVKLGDARRRWKRVAAQLAGITFIAARGLDAKGELIGSWTAPLDDADDEEEDFESDDQAAHRHHTQWVIKEVARIYEQQSKLTTELVGAVVDIIKALRATVTTPQQPTPQESDDATRVLGQLLTAAMSNNRSTNAAAEEIADEGSDGSDATVQGQSPQHPQAGEG
jgi:hypothetical protein